MREQYQEVYHIPRKYTRRIKHEIRICYCGKPFQMKVWDKPNRFCCSRSCASRLRGTGERNVLWKGGKSLNKQGYVLINVGPGKRYALEHRVIMSNILGRELLSSETVHHKNGIRSDNRPENLELWNKRHGPGQRLQDVKHCPTCTCCFP